jgi:hypothetical protein
LAALNQRQLVSEVKGQQIRARDHEIAQRRPDLCQRQGALPAIRFREQLRQPGQRGDEFDANAGDDDAAPEEQLRQ